MLVDTSNREPPALVVCGTSVTKARSASSTGTLSTRQGRVFAARPRSISQTSPRDGLGGIAASFRRVAETARPRQITGYGETGVDVATARARIRS